MYSEIFTAPEKLSSEDREKAVQIFLRHFSGRTDLEFVSHHLPCTDGTRVSLGSITPRDASYETFALGSGIHEMMHVTDTDFKEVRRLDALAKRLLNVIEDVRIDRLGEEKHSESYRIWREQLADSMEARGTLRVANQCTHPTPLAEFLTNWLHCELMAHLGYGWALRHLKITRRFVEPIRTDVRRRLLQEAFKVLAAQSTKDSVRIARKLRSILRDAVREENERSQNLQAQATSQGNLFDEADPNESQSGFVQQMLNEIDAYETDRKSDPDNKSRAVAPDSSDFDEKALSRRQPDDKYRVGIWPHNFKQLPQQTARGDYAQEFQKVRNGLDALTRRFCDLLKTPDDFAGETIASDGIELRDDWIDALASRDDRLFVTYAEGRSVDAELCILVDRSGSMGLHTMTLAKVAVAALVRAVDRIRGTSTRVAFFPGLGEDHVALAKNVRDSTALFEQKLSSVDAYGSTPIVESMQWACDSFRHARARTKLLVIITDGRFNADFSKKMQAQLKANGVEFALLSIGIDNRDAADNHVLATSGKDINAALLKLLSQTAFARRLRS